MERFAARRFSIMLGLTILGFIDLAAQNSLKKTYSNSTVYAGIEVGSKGVKMSLIEFDKNGQTNSVYNVIKDSSINTDFISFSDPTSAATLTGLSNLYALASSSYKIPSNRIFTVVSSGVKMQAEKEGKVKMLNELVTAFKTRINEPERNVDIVDVREEARLSHIGIIPDSKRYTTFLIDVGSGNAKGGYFPYGNTKAFKLFQLNWGTKSVANATEKRCDENDKTLANFNKQLFRVLSIAENTEIIFAVNESGSYPLTDNIAFSGGIAWSVATLLHPEMYDKPLVTVTFDEMKKFTERVFSDYASSLRQLFFE